MIKRVTVSLILLFFLCLTALANQEISIKLDNKDRIYRKNLGFAYITFEYLDNHGNNARVKVIVENITQATPHAVLIFRREMDDKSLKRGKPKIEFEKTYPGKKGNRRVWGCEECSRYIDIIPATETDTIFTIDVPLTSSKNFILPLYEARYKAKDLHKKRLKGLDGRYGIQYKILAEEICDVHIEVVGWSEDDSLYVETKKAVDDFLSSLDSVKFCHHEKHSPTLKEQQFPYQEKKDSLIKVVKSILDTHTEWMSDQAPHQAYTRLWSELNKVNLNDMTYDCGKHKGIHTCGLCSLSTTDIYHRLDVLYQQLHTGQINKRQALNAARSLYNCYKKSNRRKKDPSYGPKITRFYNSIANY